MSKNIGLTVLPKLRKRVEDIREKRLARLREAKATKNVKKLAEMWAEKQLAPKVLSQQQRMAIYLMCDFTHNFSYSFIANKIGVSESELSRWRSDPYFIEQLDNEVKRRKNFIVVHAFRNVHRAVLRGDMKATWNFLKMSGYLKENVELIDKTGEREMSDEELTNQIQTLQDQLVDANTPSGN